MEGVRIVNCNNGQQSNGLRYPNSNRPQEMLLSRSYFSYQSNNINTSRRSDEQLYKLPSLYKNSSVDPSRHYSRPSNSNHEYPHSKNYIESPHSNRSASNSRFYNNHNYNSPHYFRNTYKFNFSTNNMVYEDQQAFLYEREKRDTSGLRRFYKTRTIPPHTFSPFIGRNVNSYETRQHQGERIMYPPLPILEQDYLVNPDRFLNHPSIINLTPTSHFLEKKISDKLSHDIWVKYVSHKQTEEQFKKKMHLWKQLYMFIKSIFPFYGLFIVGSTMSGFSISSSDIDFCLHVRPSEMDQRIEAVAHLGQLLKFLRRLEIIDDIQLIQAKVPILKFCVTDQGFNVDINCNNSVGVRNTHLLYCYSQLDWRVKPLVILVKLWANSHHINDAKNCTISSYSLTLMVIHFLQNGIQPPVLPCLQSIYKDKFKHNSDLNQIDFYEELPPIESKNKQSLGELLKDFLKYYANFEYKLYAISVRTGTKIPICECKNVNTSKNDPHQWKLLCVEEPFDLTNAARSVYDRDVFQRIKDVFKKSHTVLETTKTLECIFK